MQEDSGASQHSTTPRSQSPIHQSPHLDNMDFSPPPLPPPVQWNVRVRVDHSTTPRSQSPIHQSPHLDNMDFSPPPLPPPVQWNVRVRVDEVPPIPTQLSNTISTSAATPLSMPPVAPPSMPGPSSIPPSVSPFMPPATSPQLTTSQPASSFDTPWTTTLVAPVVHDFVGSSGPTVPIPDTPLSIFQLFYTSDLLQTIADQSNLYATETMRQEKLEKWVPISASDIRAFLGFQMLMGINNLPEIYDYWRKDPVYHYASVADRISRDRFREISRYLHYADNSTLSPPGSDNYDRLGKVRPLLNYLQSRFMAVYTPGQQLAVDEAMIKFQGRSSLKQYMPKKPIKRGIKVWVLADSTNGYFSRLEVYTGKKGNTTEKNLGSRVVKDLTSDFQGKWHRVYFDNFFTSKALICDLEEVGIYGCGTARKDRRGFPEDLKSAKFKTR